MLSSIAITNDDDGRRFDRWYRSRIGRISQSRLERCCRQGRIRVDGRRIKCATRLEAGQRVRLPPECQPHDSKQAPDSTAAPLRTLAGLLTNPLFEDDHLLAINKPTGLAAQGGTGQSIHLDQLLAQTGTADRDPLRLIHRLDKDTSGVLLLGKTLPVVQAMGEMLRSRSIRKDYLAVTIQPPQPRMGSIAIRLKTQDRGHGVTWSHADNPVPRVGEKTALTRYRVLQTAATGPALVALAPETGRKHQLRAHLAAIHCPIIGDARYGIASELQEAMPWHAALDPALHLHALGLAFAHPITQRHLVIKAPLPAHMTKACQAFGWPEISGGDRVVLFPDSGAAS